MGEALHDLGRKGGTAHAHGLAHLRVSLAELGARAPWGDELNPWHGSRIPEPVGLRHESGFDLRPGYTAGKSSR